MEFLIADTFTDSLAKLTGQEQKAVKTTAFDLQMNPASPGLRFHKLEKVRDPNFCSVSANMDIRLIVHKTESSMLLCYVDHHDNAYAWAQRRKLETHPKTGAAQLVEIRETVKEITVPVYIEEEQAKPLLFTGVAEEILLGYGVPIDWLEDVKQANEDSLLELADYLPSEAAEALLDIATGVTPPEPVLAKAGADPFEHPDAQRRFRVMTDVDELERALDYPWEKWTIFLHPAQKEFVEREYNGPARISGSAGTGKTIVALHRAVYLVRKDPDSRVLLATFSDILASALQNKLKRLISNRPRLAERLEVHSMNDIGLRLYSSNFGKPKIADTDVISGFVNQAEKKIPEHKFSQKFLITEWLDVVDAWQLNTWEEYRDVKRLGRKTRLPEKQRQVLWSILEKVQQLLKDNNLITLSQMFNQLAVKMLESKHPAFDYAVIDEAQDVSVSQLRFLAALGGNRADGLFFAGDLGQRIFQQPFSWKALGVDIRGRSRTLRINYRTSHQIRMQADLLLDPEISDIDGNTEERRGTISVFNGPKPEILVLDSPENEIETVAKWIAKHIEDGLKPHEIGIFVRSSAEINRAREVVEAVNMPYRVLDKKIETVSGYATISTMHLAKGLEFRVVAVMACDDEVIPLQERIETVSDESDLEEVYNTERHLLYVACTRARDDLLVTAVAPASEFLDDMQYK